MAYFNAHTRVFDGPLPDVTGPIELYRPTEDGTEDLPPESNIEVEFYDTYDTFLDAVKAIDCCGRWLWSTAAEGRYLGFMNSVRGGVTVESF